MKEIIETKSNEEIQLQEAILSARKKFKSDLKPVLKSEERVNDALKIEREFLKKMRNEMNKRKFQHTKFLTNFYQFLKIV